MLNVRYLVRRFYFDMLVFYGAIILSRILGIDLSFIFYRDAFGLGFFKGSWLKVDLRLFVFLKFDNC